MTKTKVAVKQVNIINVCNARSLRITLLAVSLVFFIFFLNGVSRAQLRLAPLKRQSNNSQTKYNPNARPMEDEPLHLPFWDDFSKLSLDANGFPTGVANASQWKNSRTVWINNGMGINPPSINVATFDGLDSLYNPYSSQVLLNGFTDKLESLEIDLTDPATSPVEHQDSIYLRFFYQWQGNGEPPDPTDYMVVEFRNSLDIWTAVFTITVDDAPDPEKFYNTAIHVTSDFIHDEFQFRFRRFGRQSGPFDTWNIDYVYLNYFIIDSKSNDFESISDRATTTPLTSFFDGYTAIPYRHWVEGKKPLVHPQFGITNLKNTAPQPLNYNSDAVISNFKEGVLIDEQTQTLDVIESTPPLPALARTSVVTKTLPDTALFVNEADSVVLDYKVIFNSGDKELFDTDYFPRYDPINFRLNDTLTSRTLLYNYYAYDDGVAEYSAFLTQSGNAAAIRFDMLTERDTVIALDIYFPDFAIESSLTTNLFIYADSDGKPGTELGQKRGYTITPRGPNKFSRIIFSPAVPVNNYRFYAGWTETTEGKVKVGLDYSNDSSDKTYVKIGSVWSQEADIKGSIMIRPIFGSADLVTGVPEESDRFVGSCYPNPSNGTFFIREKYDHLQIINTTGQQIPYQTENINEETKVTLQSSPGLYLIQLRKGKFTKTNKMIIK
jgi:hypothetical protein